MEFTAEMIAGFLAGEIVGDKDTKVWTLAKIEEGTTGALSFFSNPKYEPHIYTSDASIIIVNNNFVPKEPVKATLVKVEDAYACFAKLLNLYAANKPRKTGISKQASISESATMGADCYVGEFAVVSDNVKMGDHCMIYPQVYIGDRVKMGDNVTLHPGVKIYEQCVIGNNVTIDSGAVIGADGFGWAPQADGTYSKIPQIGNVVIEDNVDIGANTCVDRATMGSTYIGKGVKFDNLVHIAHNVSIGENSVIAGLVGIAGSSKIGKGCMFGGQVGIAGHLSIGDGAQIGSKSGVSNNVAEKQAYFGYPAMPVSKYHRSHAVFRNLPELSMDVHVLKKQIKQLLETDER